MGRRRGAQRAHPERQHRPSATTQADDAATATGLRLDATVLRDADQPCATSRSDRTVIRFR